APWPVHRSRPPAPDETLGRSYLLSHDPAQGLASLGVDAPLQLHVSPAVPPRHTLERLRCLHVRADLARDLGELQPPRVLARVLPRRSSEESERDPLLIADQAK